MAPKRLLRFVPTPANKHAKLLATLGLALVLTPVLLAQPAPPAPPPAASGIVGLVQMAAGALKACKAKLCACPLGQMITNAGKPLNTALGGLLCPPCCPPVKKEDLAKPATVPAGACAKIMQEELDMPNRRAAIQCLARADCHWWPEAEKALIAGLRADRNECVRYEAAKALANGCCCTKKTIEALLISATSSKRDGNPSENSERVKTMALAALQHCLACYVEEEEPTPPELPKKPPAPAPLPPPPPGATAATAGLTPPAVVTAALDYEIPNLTYYDNLQRVSGAQLLAGARKVIQEKKDATQKQQLTQIAGPSGSRSLYQIWMNAQKEPPKQDSPRKPSAPLASVDPNMPLKLERPPAPMPVGTPNQPMLDFME